MCVEDAWKLCDQTIRIINMEERGRIEKIEHEGAQPKITEDRAASALIISHFSSSHRHRIDQGENIFQERGTRS